MSHNYGYPQQSSDQEENPLAQFPGWVQEGNLDGAPLHTPGRSSSHYSNSPGEGVGQGERYAHQGESEEDESEQDEFEEDEYEQDEVVPVFSRQGTPEYVSPSIQPDAPQSAMPAPQIQVSEHDQSSTQPDMSGNFQQAFTYGMSGSLNSPGYDYSTRLHGGLSEGSPYETPTNFLPKISPPGVVADTSSLSPQLDVSAQPLPTASGQPSGLGNFSSPPQGTGHLVMSPGPDPFLVHGVHYGSTPFDQPSQDPSPSGGSSDSESQAAHHASRLRSPSEYSPAGPGYGGTPLPFRPAGGSSSGGSGERNTPRYQPDVSLPLSAQATHGSPSPSDSESDQDSTYPGGSVAVETSPNVQAPTPAPGLPQHMEYGGTGRQKRARESPSTPSSTGHLRPQRKHRHGIEEYGYGSPGPSVPQGMRQTQQPPMQDIDRDESLLGISQFRPESQIQSQGRGGSYGDPDPRRRADAAEVERISHAYASQQMPEPRPNPAAGFRQTAPGLYARGAGPGYALPPQGESSVQGAGYLQPYPAQGPHARLSHVGGAGRGAGQPQDLAMKNVGPGEASLPMGGAWGRNAPQPQPQDPQSQRESSGQGAGYLQPSPMQPFMDPSNTGSAGHAPAPQHQRAGGAGSVDQYYQFPLENDPPQISEPGPTRDMDANALWSFMNADGPQSSLNLQWRGAVFDVNPSHPSRWSQAQMYELSVIMASFADWPEVVALGQGTPGGRSPYACAKKVQPKFRAWTEDEDEGVRGLTSPDPQLRRHIVERLHGQGRNPDEIVGRFIFFRRSPFRANLGNTVFRGLMGMRAKGWRREEDQV